MNGIFSELSDHGLIPVIKLENADSAVPLAEAMIKGGLPVAEITFRTSAAEESILRISRAYPDMLIGAGTVLTAKQAEAAAKAGAKFIVSPGLNPEVVKCCLGLGIPVAPGCSTPTDIEAALSLGLDTVKFFPAEAAGGIKMLKSLASPYAGVKFIPTGGIGEDNFADYLRLGNVIACGGSFMADGEKIKAGDFDGITADIRSAIAKLYNFRLAHIGFNLNGTEEAKNAASLTETLFGFSSDEGENGIMCGNTFEFLKIPYFGKNGHIAVKTDFIERAVKYFMRLGFTFEKEGMIYNDEGKLNAAYLTCDFCGMAIHLLRA